MPPCVAASRQHGSAGSITVLAVLIFLAATCPLSAGAPVATTVTTLTVSSPEVTAGTAVTLTATVTSSGSPSGRGVVLFCDATATRCADSAILGSASLTTAGTATIKLTLGAGTYSIVAAFQALRFTQPSASAPVALIVDGNAGYPSFSQIGSSGAPGNYTLVGAVAAFGKRLPGGTVSFLDSDSANAGVGTAALDPATLGFVLLPASSSPATVGSRAENTVLGDFNNDGILDLAVTNFGANTISVLLGNGNGSFQLQTAYATGAFPIAIAGGDFNRDGKLDLVVGNAGGATISVFLGNGDGTFLAQQTYAVGNGPQSIAVVDVDGNGFLDLAVLDRNDRNVTILLGQGDGTFQVELNICEDPLTFAVGEGGQQLVIADFNGDGKADMAVTNAQDSQVSILLGLGNGTFQTQVTYGVGFNPVGVATADFNEDGFPDLAVANAENNSISVLLGLGDGTFQTSVQYGTSNAPEGVSVGDFNGDGHMDVVVSNNGSGIVGVLLGKGDGTFETQQPFLVGNRPFGIGVGDLNGDGLPDVLVANSNQTTASVLLSAQTETATTTGRAVYGTGSHDVLASYAGDTDRAASESDTVLLVATPQTVTATTLTVAPNPSSAGQAVTLTATVLPAPSGTPGGTVSFFNGSTLLGAGAVNSSGVARFTSSSLPAGTSSLTAVYSGNYGNAGSTSLAQSLTINPQTATTTALQAAPNPSTGGEAVTLSATVTPAPNGTPAGTVSFFSGSMLLGTASLNSSGVATFISSTLPAGTNTITAQYSGTAGAAASTSLGVEVTVAALASTFAVSAPQSPFTVNAGGSVDINVTVPPIGGDFNSVVIMSASGLPSGAVATFNPVTVIPGASGANTVLHIQTATRTGALPNPQKQFPFLPLSLAAGLCVMAGQRKRMARSGRLLVLTAMLAGGTLLLTACNGGFAGTSQSFPVTITGTSGSQHVSTSVILIMK
jgi:Bacterial Ig-like domain (group 3)/FG-GAP-like repeat/FG-GAP repeat